MPSIVDERLHVRLAAPRVYPTLGKACICEIARLRTICRNHMYYQRLRVGTHDKVSRYLRSKLRPPSTV